MSKGRSVRILGPIFWKALAISLLVLATTGAAVTMAVPIPNPHAAAHLLDFPAGFCSATAIGPRAVLTATHCFTEGGEVTQLKVDGRMVDIWKRMDDGHDHTIILVSKVFTQYARIDTSIRRGEHVYVYGNPGPLRDIYREGVVSGGLKIDGLAATLMQLPIFFGDSGSGVFNARGEVVGVITGTYRLESKGFILQLAVVFPLAFTMKQYAKAGVG